ncbi:hypothetical protein LCGC14_1036030 [marine sediment metagenome]|uniref:Uncharacterized protein n=1 Tax=marine sediment metagenome TaxID=412755 RepID=A0A0F9QBB7_9ZZZZ
MGNIDIKKIYIYEGIYVFSWKEAYFRYEFYLNKKIFLMELPNKFKDLLSEKAKKFNDKYGINDMPITIGKDPFNKIQAIAICYPYFDNFSPKIGVDIVTGRIRRMRGDLKLETYKPKRDKHGKVILDENKKPIMQHRKKYHVPYDLYAKILDKNGDEKLKYPYINKYG